MIVEGRLAGWALVSLCAAGCVCDPQDEPCEDWSRIGETYTVELVKHVDFGYFDGTTFSGHADRTCGSDFDLDTGSVIHIKAAGKLGQYHGGGCGPDCYAVRAEASIGTVAFEGDQPQGIHTIGHNRFRQDARATIRSGPCRGTYQIGVERVDRYYGAAKPEEALATDFLVYRGFQADPSVLDACAANGSRIKDSDQTGICTDAWSVRIRDSSGTLLSSDQTLPPITDASSPSAGHGDELDASSDDSGSDS